MFGLRRRIRRHALISSAFLTIGALVPLILTFLLIDFFPGFYASALRVADPIARNLSTQVFAIHDERTLNAFNATFDSAALVATYIGLIVGRLLAPVQRYVEARFPQHDKEARSQISRSP